MLDNLKKQLGVMPALLLGAGLVVTGLAILNGITTNWWPFDVARLDLVRAAPGGQAPASALLDAAEWQVIAAFLGGVLLAATGIAMPLAFVINKRFSVYANRQLGQTEVPSFLITVRQAVEVGVWAAFCTWLQMNRALGVAVALLVAVVLIMFEFLLQVRARTASSAG